MKSGAGDGARVRSGAGCSAAQRSRQHTAHYIAYARASQAGTPLAMHSDALHAHLYGLAWVGKGRSLHKGIHHITVAHVGVGDGVAAAGAERRLHAAH